MMETIAWVAFSQSLFSAILVGTKQENSVADKILSAWLSLLAIEFLTCALDYRIFGEPLLSSSFLLINPAFYLYVKSLLVKDFQLKWAQLFHLAPFIVFETIAYLVNEPFSIQAYFESKITHWYGYLFSLVSFLSWIYYNSSSAVLVIKHRKRLRDEFSTIESSKKVTWIFFIVIFYSLYAAAVVVMAISVLVLHTNFLLPHVFNYAALLVLVYILGFYGLVQKKIVPVIENEAPAEEKYRFSALGSDQKLRIERKLLEYFTDEKPYLNPDLNMDMLAGKLEVQKYQLTEVLNSVIGKNFFRFVNEYRVEAVKKMLSDNKNPYSVEAVGYECGFSSKSSFFTGFKNITGQTPMHFKKNLTESKPG